METTRLKHASSSSSSSEASRQAQIGRPNYLPGAGPIRQVPPHHAPSQAGLQPQGGWAPTASADCFALPTNTGDRVKTEAAEEAVRLFDGLLARGIQPDIETYKTTLDACKVGKAHELAHRVFEHLLNQGIAAGVLPRKMDFNVGIRTARGADDALRYFNRMLVDASRWGVLPDNFTYTAAIKVCADAGRWQNALELLQHALDHGPVHGVFPNSYTYSSAIAACAVAGRAEEALGAFVHMLIHGPHHGVAPDIVTYNSLLKACGNANRPELATMVWEHLEKECAARRVSPDIITFSTLMSLWPERAQTFLDSAIAARLIRTSFGLDTQENLLVLFEDSVLEEGDRKPRGGAINAALAKAIFAHMLAAGAIDERTRIVVGRGIGGLCEAISECMVKAKWVPHHPYRHHRSEQPNLGSLRGSGPGRAVGDTTPVTVFAGDR